MTSGDLATCLLSQVCFVHSWCLDQPLLLIRAAARHRPLLAVAVRQQIKRMSTIHTGGFPHKSAMAFSGSLLLVALGLALFTCGGTVYPKSSPEERYRVIR